VVVCKTHGGHDSQKSSVHNVVKAFNLQGRTEVVWETHDVLCCRGRCVTALTGASQRFTASLPTGVDCVGLATTDRQLRPERRSSTRAISVNITHCWNYLHPRRAFVVLLAIAHRRAFQLERPPISARSHDEGPGSTDGLEEDVQQNGSEKQPMPTRGIDTTNGAHYCKGI
jgi:hypothetical protein